jgi:hypothetical protein
MECWSDGLRERNNRLIPSNFSIQYSYFSNTPSFHGGLRWHGIALNGYPASPANYASWYHGVLNKLGELPALRLDKEIWRSISCIPEILP